MAKAYLLDIRKKHWNTWRKEIGERNKRDIWNIKTDDNKMKETKREGRLEETGRFVKRFKIVQNRYRPQKTLWTAI
ncbi:hypothetical protein AGMMS49592_2110 [Endomicrobiia bacterium]|nr:hypothetical protein AGMMS49592_2110 [Endomicrobiia bacterium]